MFLVWASESRGRIAVKLGFIDEDLGLGIPWHIVVKLEEALIVLM